jgi:hypothetical protein
MSSKKFKPIMVDEKLKEKIEFIAKVTGQSQHKVLESIVEPIYSVASTFNKATFESYDRISERSVWFQFFGSDKSLILGEVKDCPSLDSKTNEILAEKILELDLDKLARDSSKKETKKQ